MAKTQLLFGVEFWNSKNTQKYYFLLQTRKKSILQVEEKVYYRYKRRYITGTREGILQVQEKIYYRYKRRYITGTREDILQVQVCDLFAPLALILRTSMRKAFLLEF